MLQVALEFYLNTPSPLACKEPMGPTLMIGMVRSSVCVQCCTCDLCGCGTVFEFIFAAAGTAWWAIAALVLMKRAFVADSSGIEMVRPAST